MKVSKVLGVRGNTADDGGGKMSAEEQEQAANENPFLLLEVHEDSERERNLALERAYQAVLGEAIRISEKEFDALTISDDEALLLAEAMAENDRQEKAEKERQDEEDFVLAVRIATQPETHETQEPEPCEHDEDEEADRLLAMRMSQEWEPWVQSEDEEEGHNLEADRLPALILQQDTSAHVPTGELDDRALAERLEREQGHEGPAQVRADEVLAGELVQAFAERDAMATEDTLSRVLWLAEREALQVVEREAAHVLDDGVDDDLAYAAQLQQQQQQAQKEQEALPAEVPPNEALVCEIMRELAESDLMLQEDSAGLGWRLHEEGDHRAPGAGVPDALDYDEALATQVDLDDRTEEREQSAKDRHLAERVQHNEVARWERERAYEEYVARMYDPTAFTAWNGRPPGSLLDPTWTAVSRDAAPAAWTPVGVISRVHPPPPSSAASSSSASPPSSAASPSSSTPSPPSSSQRPGNGSAGVATSRGHGYRPPAAVVEVDNRPRVFPAGEEHKSFDTHKVVERIDKRRLLVVKAVLDAFKVEREAAIHELKRRIDRLEHGWETLTKPLKTLQKCVLLEQIVLSYLEQFHGAEVDDGTHPTLIILSHHILFLSDGRPPEASGHLSHLHTFLFVLSFCCPSFFADGCCRAEVTYIFRDYSRRGRLYAVAGKEVKLEGLLDGYDSDDGRRKVKVDRFTGKPLGSGRGATLQSMIRHLRAPLVDAFAFDIDAVNSDGQLLISLARTTNVDMEKIPTLAAYCAHRNERLQKIMTAFSVEKEAAKRLTTIVLSGGGYATWEEKYLSTSTSAGDGAVDAETKVLTPEQREVKQFADRLQQELNWLARVLLAKPQFDWLRNERQKLIEEDDKRNPTKLLLGRIVQSSENQVLEIVHKVFFKSGWCVRAKVFDGLVVEPGVGAMKRIVAADVPVKDALDDLLRRAEAKCEEEFWEVRLIEKPLHGLQDQPIETIEQAKAALQSLRQQLSSHR